MHLPEQLTARAAILADDALAIAEDEALNFNRYRLARAAFLLAHELRAATKAPDAPALAASLRAIGYYRKAIEAAGEELAEDVLEALTEAARLADELAPFAADAGDPDESLASLDPAALLEGARRLLARAGDGRRLGIDFDDFSPAGAAVDLVLETVEAALSRLRDHEPLGALRDELVVAIAHLEAEAGRYEIEPSTVGAAASLVEKAVAIAA